jgi:hypothetical protein
LPDTNTLAYLQPALVATKKKVSQHRHLVAGLRVFAFVVVIVVVVVDDDHLAGSNLLRLLRQLIVDVLLNLEFPENEKN